MHVGSSIVQRIMLKVQVTVFHLQALLSWNHRTWEVACPVKCILPRQRRDRAGSNPMLNRREFNFFPYWHISFYYKQKWIFLVYRMQVLCMSSLCNPNEECWEGKKGNFFNSPGCVQTLPLCVNLGHLPATAATCWWFSRLKHSKKFLWDISLNDNLIFSIMKLRPNYVLLHPIRFIRLKVSVSLLIQRGQVAISVALQTSLRCCCRGEWLQHGFCTTL